MELRGKQKRFLRSQAHHLQPIFQIGKNGINDAVIVQINEALEKGIDQNQFIAKY